MLAEIEAAGLEVDNGCTIGGLFIDDGVTRIHEGVSVVAEGATLEDAYDSWQSRCGCGCLS